MLSGRRARALPTITPAVGISQEMSGVCRMRIATASHIDDHTFDVWLVNSAHTAASYHLARPHHALWLLRRPHRDVAQCVSAALLQL